MFRVEWLQPAVDELTALWIQADSAQRQALTAASHAIDQRLSINPRGEGESRAGNRRIAFFPPLFVTFEIDDDHQTVVVGQVRLFRRRPP
jgi:hypothetical protein